MWFETHHIDSRHLYATYFQTVIGRWENVDRIFLRKDVKLRASKIDMKVDIQK